MIALTWLSPQVSASVLRHTQRKLLEFTDFGINSRLDVISLENVEYVSRLLALEIVLPDYRRTDRDRRILISLCNQFCASGISKLQEWAIGQLRLEKISLEQEIANCESTVAAILKKLESLET